MTTAQIMERLADGPKTYGQLKGLCGNLDFLIAKLLRSKEIVFLPTGQRAIFSLPPKPKEDDPLPPSKKVLGLCKPRKKKTGTKTHNLDKAGRKKCSACNRRRSSIRFACVGGVLDEVCNECKT